MEQEQHEAGSMAHRKADVTEYHQPRFFPALAAQRHLERNHIVAVIFLDRLDDVEFAAILIVLHPLHVLAEAQHHPRDHILHGDLLFRGKGDPPLGAVALVEFDGERILRIAARRPGGFLRLAAVTLHLHDDFLAVRVIRIDLRQAFQFGQVFRVDIAVKFEQRAVVVVVVSLLLVQVVEFPLHVDDGGVHEFGDIHVLVEKLVAAEITVKDLIEHRDVIDILHQCQAQQLPGRPAPFHAAEPQGLNRIQAFSG